MAKRFSELNFALGKLGVALLVGCLALITCTGTGCGQSQYDRRMEKRISELRRAEAANGGQDRSRQAELDEDEEDF